MFKKEKCTRHKDVSSSGSTLARAADQLILSLVLWAGIWGWTVQFPRLVNLTSYIKLPFSAIQDLQWLQGHLEDIKKIKPEGAKQLYFLECENPWNPQMTYELKWSAGY